MKQFCEYNGSIKKRKMGNIFRKRTILRFEAVGSYISTYSEIFTNYHSAAMVDQGRFNSNGSSKALA